MFIQQKRQGRRTLCTTEQLISLDNRQNEVHLEVTMMAGNAIAGLLVDIRKR